MGIGVRGNVFVEHLAAKRNALPVTGARLCRLRSTVSLAAVKESAALVQYVFTTFF